MTRRFNRSAAVQRLAWLDGLRLLAVVMILLYHAQQLFTRYAYTPQPTGLVSNLQQLIAGVGSLETLTGWVHLVGTPALFGFQFIDVLILLCGFSWTLTHRRHDPLGFWQKRLLRLLWPVWTIALLSYPVLWAMGTAASDDIPPLWNLFAASTYPLLFDYRGSLLLPISGSWWFIPLILSFTLCFPLLHGLMYRWGGRNLVGMALVITLGYRVLAIYLLGAQPPFTLTGSAGALPFYGLLAKLSTFVIGMVVAQAYKHGRGVLFWSQARALRVGLMLYGVGFIGQFYRSGWVFCDVVAPLGLSLVGVVVCRWWTAAPWGRQLALNLGKYGYSFFLIHHLVVDRTLGLVVEGNAVNYAIATPLMILAPRKIACVPDRL